MGLKRRRQIEMIAQIEGHQPQSPLGSLFIRIHHAHRVVHAVSPSMTIE